MTLSPVLSMNNDAFTSIIKFVPLCISFHVSPSLVVLFHCILFVLAYSEDLWPAINNRSYFTLLRIYRDFTLQLLIDVFSFYLVCCLCVVYSPLRQSHTTHTTLHASLTHRHHSTYSFIRLFSIYLHSVTCYEFYIILP